MTFNCDNIFLPVDFLKAQSRTLYLVVDERNGNVARVTHKNKNYYLNLEIKKFKEAKWPSQSSWHTLIGNNADLKLRNLINEDKSLRNILSKLQNCVNTEDAKCITSLETKNSHFKEMLKYRMIADDPHLCKKFQNFGGENFEEDMDEIIKVDKVKDSPMVWSLFRALLNLDDKVEKRLNTDSSQKVTNINLNSKLSKNLNCGNLIDLSLELKSRENIRGEKEWVIISFETFGRDKTK